MSPRDGRKLRTDVSATLFLTNPDEYDGGELQIEDTYGRDRSGTQNDPRTLDIDLIVLGETASQTDPVLPHPRASERAFVLKPWHDVEPEAVLPGHGPIAGLLPKVAGQVVRRRDDLTLREE